jgi:hypothetical protein
MICSMARYQRARHKRKKLMSNESVLALLKVLNQFIIGTFKGKLFGMWRRAIELIILKAGKRLFETIK